MLASIKRMALVIFITVLIWIWADLAQSDTMTDVAATVIVSKSTDPNLWISFDGSASANINISLSSSRSKIAEINRQLNEGTLELIFYLDAQRQKMQAPGYHKLKMLDFLRDSSELRQLGIRAESCEPEYLTATVVPLQQQSMIVEAFDGNGIKIDTKSIEPASVEMYVPQDWKGETLRARVKLTNREIEQARAGNTLERLPEVEFPGGKIELSETPVKIKLPAAAQQLNPYQITTTTIGFTFSANLQGKYKVDLINESEVMSAIKIKASADAKQLYDSEEFKMTLDILDDDEKQTEPVSRPVKYNFPLEYVKAGEIVLDQSAPVMATFRLRKIPSSPPQQGAP